MEQLYIGATGRLGYTDEQAMNTPMPRLALALKGHGDFAIQFARLILQIPEPPEPPQELNRAEVAKKTRDVFRRMARAHKRKNDGRPR